MKQFHPCFYPPLFKFSVTYTTSCETYSLLLNTDFHSRKTSPVTAAFLQANSVYIPFWSHLWETDKTICQITLAERHSSARLTYVGLIEPPGFVSRRQG